jgi:hypothetical protein
VSRRYFLAGVFGGGGFPDELPVFAGEPVEPADEGSRGSGVIAPVVAAVPGVIAGEPETVDPEPVAVGRSEPPPDAPDGGVETWASAPWVSAMMMTVPATAIFMMIVSLRPRAEVRRMRGELSGPTPRAVRAFLRGAAARSWNFSSVAGVCQIPGHLVLPAFPLCIGRLL